MRVVCSSPLTLLTPDRAMRRRYSNDELRSPTITTATCVE